MTENDLGAHHGGPEIAEAVRSLTATADQPAVAERLWRYATRHLPIPGAGAGSQFVPPVYGWRIAVSLGLEQKLAARLSAASCLYFAAADLFDDVADGDTRWALGQDVNDACRLLFLQHAALASLDVDAAVHRALVGLYAEQGLRMAQGQGWDLAGTNAMSARSPLTVARLKSGAEFSACMAAPAVVAGRAAEPWVRFGAAFGALAQTLSDYFNLFLDPESDDWSAGKPTLPIRGALAHATQREAVFELLAGARARPDRKAAGLWHLVQAGAAEQLADARTRLGAEMQDAAAVAEAPWLLAFPGELDDWIDGVIDALTEFADDPAPRVRGLAPELAAARAATRTWLSTAGRDAASRPHRVGMLAGPEVREDVFGPALVCLLAPQAPDRKRVVKRLLRGQGAWSELSGSTTLPASADATGLVLQLMARERPGHRRVRAAASELAAGIDAAGVPLWLPGTAHEDGWVDPDARDPVATANALSGLRAVGWRTPAIGAGLAALVEGLADDALSSARYRTAALDFFVVRAAVQARATCPEVDAALVRRAADLAERIGARQRLDGHFGGALDTALCAAALMDLDALQHAQSVARALVDAQAPDGGYPAAPLRLAVPTEPPSWYGSRLVSSAIIDAVLERIQRTRF